MFHEYKSLRDISREISKESFLDMIRYRSIKFQYNEKCMWHNKSENENVI